METVKVIYLLAIYNGKESGRNSLAVPWLRLGAFAAVARLQSWLIASALK